MAERLAILASLLVGRNAAAQRTLRSPRYRRPELEPFDAALNALQHRSADGAADACAALKKAGAGGFAMLIEQVTPILFGRTTEDGELDGLTGAELQVLRGMALGLSNQAIADEQRRGINTIRTHVSSVLRKLGATSRGEAVALARRKALI